MQPTNSKELKIGPARNSQRKFKKSSWLGRSCRLSRDYERKAQVAEAFVYLAMCRLMLHRWIKN